MTDAEKLDRAEEAMRLIAEHCRVRAESAVGDDNAAIISRAVSEMQSITYMACADIIRDFRRGRE